MSIIRRVWRINDGAGDPQATYWTESETQAAYVRDRYEGAEVMEYVPASQLEGAVEENRILRRALYLACKAHGSNPDAMRDGYIKRAGDEFPNPGGQ